MSDHAPQDAGQDLPPPEAGLDTAASRIEWLIDAYFDGQLESDQRHELRHELLSSPTSRQLFWQMARLKVALYYWAGEHWGEEAAVRDAQRCSIPTTTRTKHQWCEPFSRLRGFAATIAACFVSAGVAVGSSRALSPPALPLVRHSLPVGNPGFEEPLSVKRTSRSRLPADFGYWAGDDVVAITERAGVTPPEGRRMIAFEEALDEPRELGTGWSRACDFYQLIDLRPYQQLATDRQAVLQLSARFRNAADANVSADTTPTRFTCRIRMFNGPVEDVISDWPHAASREVAMGAELMSLSPSGLSGSWHDVVAHAIMPASATFAVIHIAASPDSHRESVATSQAYRFPLALCDDVRVDLLTHDDSAGSLAPRR